MNRLIKTILLATIILGGGWALYHRNQIHSLGDAWQLAKHQIRVNESSWADGKEQMGAYFQTRLSGMNRNTNGNSYLRNVPVRNVNNSQRISGDLPVITIAAFKIDSVGEVPSVGRAAEIVSRFDVVALQNQSALPIAQLVAELNRRGFDFRFVDQATSSQRFATIFNRQRVMLDEQHWYTVNDPENIFQQKPLVAWFRAANVPYDQAFTFSMVNFQINSRRPDQELNYLGELFRAVRSDGRGEDDIVIAGDFQSSDRQFRSLTKEFGLVPAIVGLPTNTRNDTQLDNLLFDNNATIEFTGQSGVFDFMKRLNLTLTDAMSISRRMPVWASFSAIEGHSPGRAARNEVYVPYPNR